MILDQTQLRLPGLASRGLRTLGQALHITNCMINDFTEADDVPAKTVHE
jgi:hypothetical protein